VKVRSNTLGALPGTAVETRRRVAASTTPLPVEWYEVGTDNMPTIANAVLIVEKMRGIPDHHVLIYYHFPVLEVVEVSSCITEKDGGRWRLGEEGLKVREMRFVVGVRYRLYHDRPR
jgi:hypothetical protein